MTGAAGPLPFDAPRFAELRRMLDGVDLARAEDLGRGLHVTAYRAGDWVVRIPETDRARRTTARQAQLYRILAGLGLAVPRDARTAHDDAGVVTAGIYRWIDGDRACAERRTDRLAGDLGRFLATLHGVPLAAVAACCDVIDDPCRRFARCWERCHAHLPGAERAWLGGVIESFPAVSAAARGFLAPIHDDLAEEHVLVGADGGLAGVIDFNGPRIGDPALDLGTLRERFDGPFADAVLAAYGRVADPGFAGRARVYADVRPLVTIALGLSDRSEERFRLGLRRLAARMTLARERG